jgi:hypothetical protein
MGVKTKRNVLLAGYIVGGGAGEIVEMEQEV